MTLEELFAGLAVTAETVTITDTANPTKVIYKRYAEIGIDNPLYDECTGLRITKILLQFEEVYPSVSLRFNRRRFNG